MQSPLGGLAMWFIWAVAWLGLGIGLGLRLDIQSVSNPLFESQTATLMRRGGTWAGGARTAEGGVRVRGRLQRREVGGPAQAATRGLPGGAQGGATVRECADGGGDEALG